MNYTTYMRGSRVGGGNPDPTPEQIQKIGFLSNSGPYPLKNHKATKPEFNICPSSMFRQRNAIKMARL